MKLCILDQAQITNVYHTHMTEDFPRNELKPLNIIKGMLSKGIYEGLALYHQDELAAYALLVKHERKKTLLLDYLAVTKAYRAAGAGSSFLKLLQDHYTGWRAVLLECESECSAADGEQLQMRKRRIRFYLRNGCLRTNVRSILFGVEYEILCLNLDDWRINPAAELKELYRLILPETMMQEKVSLWTRNRILCEVSGWQPADQAWQDSVSLCSALGIGTGAGQVMPRFISFVGAGGKTTTMYQLADELAEHGLNILVTTSTHIRCPDTGWVSCSTMEEAVREGFKERILTVGTLKPGSGKLSAPKDLMDAAVVKRVLLKADVILVEADGAKRYPLKVPAGHEPVLAESTDMVIACAGLTALDKTFLAGCFRFLEHGDWLHRHAEDQITAADAALILMDERGSKKGVSRLSRCGFRVVLNQADHDGLKRQAGELVRLLPGVMQSGCVMTAYERNEEGYGYRGSL